MTASISIITATYNSATTVRDCLDSIRDQEVSAEHIIIDGVSRDQTLKIVRSYPHVGKIISEPDSGIYDAMNKGIEATSGEVIGILNSDDFYADNEALKQVAELFSDPAVETSYGDLHYVDVVNANKVVRNWKSGPYRRSAFYWGWMPPHPTFFVRRSVYERFGIFNIALGSAADYELMLRFLLKHQVNSVYLPRVLVKMRTGGASNNSLQSRWKANRMDRLAWTVNGLKPYPWTTYLKPISKIKQFLV